LTISTEPSPLSYSGDDATVAFPVTWKYFAKSHVVATLRSAAGAETVWVLDTDYTLTAADVDAGGTLTATTAPATNQTLVITLEPPNTQSESLPLGGPFPSPSVEDGLDLAAQRDSKIENLVDRCLRVPVTDTQSGSELELPIDSDRASMFLAFDASGAPIAAAGTSADLGPVTSFINTLLDDTTAADARTTLGVPSNAESILDTLVTTTGDIIYASAANTPARLAVGTASQVLLGGTTPSWGTIPNATQAEMEAAASTTVAVTPGRQYFHPAMPKYVGRISALASSPPTQFALFNALGAITLTRNGAGNHTFAWTNALNNINVQITSESDDPASPRIHNTYTGEPVSSGATSFRIVSMTAGVVAVDVNSLFVVIWGDLA